MGSIAGILSPSESDERDSIKRMLLEAPHRGLRLSTCRLGNAALGAGAGDGLGEAVVSADQALAVAFCGYLDNKENLQQEFKSDLEPGQTVSSAGLLKAIFRVHGSNTPGKLRGTYSCIVTDGNSIWFFRDHLGFRSLFFGRVGAALYIATESKQVIAGTDLEPEPDLDVVERILFGRMGEDSGCALKGVERVPRGCIVSGSLASLQTQRYWHPRRLLEQSSYRQQEIAERFDYLMTQAVNRCLVGDDVVSLSGGIDSPALCPYGATLFKNRFGKSLPALSALYPQFPKVDETEYIHAVADRYGMPANTYQALASPLDDLQRWVELFDSPVPVISLSETHEHLQEARALGFRNMLTGEFAEFVFDMRVYLLPHLIRRGRVLPALRLMGQRRAHGARRRTLIRETARGLLPNWALRMHRRLKHGSERIAAPDWLDASAYPPIHGIAEGNRWIEDQLIAFKGPALAIEVDDFIQSVAGVSTRRPWADVDLWEFFLGLPAQIKHPTLQSKSLVRRLLRGKVPDIILDRTDKTVFDDYIAAHIDYEELGRWLRNPTHPLPVVDYTLLAERIRDRNMNLVEFMWAKDLAAAHAFLDLF